MLRVGKKVRWTSQSSGTWRVKLGEVVAVVPPQSDPNVILPQVSADLRMVRSGSKLSRLVSRIGSGLPRDHESYLIVVSDQAQHRVYWPVVANLVEGW
jgi:hypothetical protein